MNMKYKVISNKQIKNSVGTHMVDSHTVHIRWETVFDREEDAILEADKLNKGWSSWTAEIEKINIE